MTTARARDECVRQPRGTLAHVVRDGQARIAGRLSAGSLTFDPNDGSVRGNDLCNEFTGSVDITDTNMVDSASRHLGERPACTPPASERQFRRRHGAVRDGVAIRRRSNELTLTDLANGDDWSTTFRPSGTVKTPVDSVGADWNLTSVRSATMRTRTGQLRPRQSLLTFYGTGYSPYSIAATPVRDSSIADAR